MNCRHVDGARQSDSARNSLPPVGAVNKPGRRSLHGFTRYGIGQTQRARSKVWWNRPRLNSVKRSANDEPRCQPYCLLAGRTLITASRKRHSFIRRLERITLKSIQSYHCITLTLVCVSALCTMHGAPPGLVTLRLVDPLLLEVELLRFRSRAIVQTTRRPFASLASNQAVGIMSPKRAIASLSH